ncbi:Xaa-Pro aminopeptidase [Kineosphaera limosa]|uniref:Xaa-Pro aminopeptidase n=1 Tax=Kineosphaera limosa NBRC 100340 TaxID=1184609 RepID=K6WV51_9MICO|nr:aminopeptidase P family protein [Kineosphaera limosa]NYE02493.1 Xaa-Pro aminopeptidase [Kineosphaera limosa]GAB95982.1 Xaa-Pro aminopeptidase [Kineosphaera limosa NBRC 100340]
MSEKQAKAEHRSRPTSQNFKDFIATGWAPRDETLPQLAESSRWAAPRRDALSAQFAGERLVIPAGGLKVRSNDTDYVFRPHTAFAHLTGLGSDREPDAVLVLEPLPEGGHEPVLYFMPLAPRDSEEFFADARVGEFWVGARPTLESMAAEIGVATQPVENLRDALAKDAGLVPLRVVRDADAQVSAMVDQIRSESGLVQSVESQEEAVESDTALARALSTMRMVKDDWEADQMREACAATARAFEAVVADLPEAVRRGRGERWVEGMFGLHARHAGNGVGYDSICASGDHANTLHWIKNTGDVRPGDLILIDAGVEIDSLFTADVTRTLPINGRFSDAQRRVYDAVYAAQVAGIEACRPGNKFEDVHAAAIRVIAEHLYDWGLLPDGVDVEATLDKEGQWHRRWMVHGTSHHLGLDVHDCTLALREDYMEGELTPGMVLTVEPGLYFKADDELVPDELRGIGVRIEDDILITADGCENLSAALPRTSTDVEAWMAKLWAAQA